MTSSHSSVPFCPTAASPANSDRRDATGFSIGQALARHHLAVALSQERTRGREYSYAGIARLKPSVTIALANQDLARVWKIWEETGGAAETLDCDSQ
jgi:hypothetical protein